jgi:hypothetical protein
MRMPGEACRGDSTLDARIRAARVSRMPRPRSTRLTSLVLGAAASFALVLALAACAPDAGGTPRPSGSGSSQTPSDAPTGSPSATPRSSATPAAAIPDDCEAMLSAGVLAQLEGVPLNDPALVEPTGAQPDGSLNCVWRDPKSDYPFIRTTIIHLSRGPALDQLNALANDEGFTCYTPDGGTRCEKSWPGQAESITDGRTLFWRDGILIDTQYSNLAPEGYTASIVDHIWG